MLFVFTPESLTSLNHAMIQTSPLELFSVGGTIGLNISEGPCKYDVRKAESFKNSRINVVKKYVGLYMKKNVRFLCDNVFMQDIQKSCYLNSIQTLDSYKSSIYLFYQNSA